MKKAFTLIELLVVIAIIAILAAILFPVFAQAKVAAKKAAGLAQMKQVGTALQIYLADADDTLPGYRWGSSSGPIINTYYLSLPVGDPKRALFDSAGATTIRAEFFNQILQPYTKSNDLMKAASNPNAWVNYQDKGTWDPNFFAYGGQNSIGASNYLLKSNASMSATQIENVSNTLLFVDATYYNVLPAQPATPCKLNGFLPSGSYLHYWKQLGNSTLNFNALGNPDPDNVANASVVRNVENRYSGQLNVVRADSSAKSFAARAVINDLRAKGPLESMWSPFKSACEL